MISFESDYTEGAHEKILDALLRTNRESQPGYGSDSYSESAKEKIRRACGTPEAEIHFLVVGTQTNAVVIDTMLQPYEGVVAAKTGHISTHEAGAIEFTGHKVLELDGVHGKIVPERLNNFLEAFHQDGNREHMVYPGMVYISHPTEYGTLYSLEELKQLSDICHSYNIPLYLDGARLGYGLMSSETDVALQDVASCCDVFYIGGTKVVALCGEAVVFPGGNGPMHFMTMVKQHGALLAKGRLTGVQFDTLFTDDLYFKISRHAIEMAGLLKEVLQKAGCRFFMDSPTNQQFIILEDEELERLSKEVRFSFWEKYDDKHTVVRLATSWATKEEDIYRLSELLSDNREK